MMGGITNARRTWVILAVLAGVIVAGVGGTWLYQQDQTRKDAEFATTLKIKSLEESGVGGRQKSLYEYDPTEHKAMFVIVGVDKEARTMRLKFIFPAKMKGNEIVSKVSCSVGNTKIYNGSGSEVTKAEKTVYEEERIKPGETIMQAICADQYCRNIRKYCELWLKE